MVRVELSVDINRPPSEVFAYLTDATHLPEWQSSALEARWEGEKGRGGRVKEVRKFLGRCELRPVLEAVADDEKRRPRVRAAELPE